MNANPSSKQLSEHIHQVFFGGNWTWSNFKDQLSDVTAEEALRQVGDLNTIAKLAYHIGYFVAAQKRVLEGQALDAHDKFSYDHPPLNSEETWRAMVEAILEDAEALSSLVAELPEEQLARHFVEEKYGSYFRNLLGLIEHTHYHLGQIALVKKSIRS